jgi:hypothetical protein
MEHIRTVLCFPGVGLTTYLKNRGGTNYQNLLDMSNPPIDIISHINSETATGKTPFVPWVPGRHSRLLDSGISFYFVYPRYYKIDAKYNSVHQKASLKFEYMYRLKCNGSPRSSISELYKKWDKWLSEICLSEGFLHLPLDSECYLEYHRPYFGNFPDEKWDEVNKKWVVT